MTRDLSLTEQIAQVERKLDLRRERTRRHLDESRAALRRLTDKLPLVAAAGALAVGVMAGRSRSAPAMTATGTAQYGCRSNSACRGEHPGKAGNVTRCALAVDGLSSVATPGRVQELTVGAHPHRGSVVTVLQSIPISSAAEGPLQRARWLPFRERSSIADMHHVIEHPPLTLEYNMNFVIWLIIGGVLGWLASLVMKTDGQQGIFLNVVVGIIGALVAGFVVAPFLGTGTINSNDFSISGLLVSFAGAVILLAIVNMFRRGRVR